MKISTYCLILNLVSSFILGLSGGEDVFIITTAITFSTLFIVLAIEELGKR